jgi:flagellar hook-associated protein 3 FlgL
LQDIATSQSQLQDLDYASAISRMNQQMVGLQAAQQSFSTIARLTLFNYL